MSNTVVTRLGAEALGTLFFVFLAAGAMAAGATDLTAAAAWALALAIAVWIFSAGGGHLNPWVTVTLALRGKFKWADVPGHVIAQLVGGLVGALLAWWLYDKASAGTSAEAATTRTAAEGADLIGAVVAEALVTLVLVLVVLQLLGKGRWTYGLGYGLAYGVGILAVGALTGASANFARTLGGELTCMISGGTADWANIWVYLVGPAIGVVLAWLVHPLLNTSEAAESHQGNRGRSTSPGRAA